MQRSLISSPFSVAVRTPISIKILNGGLQLANHSTPLLDFLAFHVGGVRQHFVHQTDLVDRLINAVFHDDLPANDNSLDRARTSLSCSSRCNTCHRESTG